MPLAGSLTMGQGNNAQTGTVPGTKIDLSNLRPTTRFSDLHDDLKKQIEELNTLATAKDKECLAAAKARREAEDALEQLKVRLEDTRKSFESLRKAKATVNSTSAEEWRVSFYNKRRPGARALLINF